MKEVELGSLREGQEFLFESSWGLELARVEGFFRADRVWYVTEKGGRDWMYTTVRVEVDD
jgi:hypothetical protein